MPISISQSMMREIIMDHYSSPRHKTQPKNPAEYQQIHMDSASCIDDIMVYVKVENVSIFFFYIPSDLCSKCSEFLAKNRTD